MIEDSFDRMGCVLSDFLFTKEQKKRKREKKSYFSQPQRRISSPVPQTEETLFRMTVMKEQANILRRMSVGVENIQEGLLPQGFDRKKQWREWRPRKMIYIGQDEEQNNHKSSRMV